MNRSKSVNIFQDIRVNHGIRKSAESAAEGSRDANARVENHQAANTPKHRPRQKTYKRTMPSPVFSQELIACTKARKSTDQEPRC
jgi:hypothetical protein